LLTVANQPNFNEYFYSSKDVGNSKSLKRLDCRQNQLAEVPSLIKCPSLKVILMGHLIMMPHPNNHTSTSICTTSIV
jgi:Leucine-rich repeat (LRR) protein